MTAFVFVETGLVGTGNDPSMKRTFGLSRGTWRALSVACGLAFFVTALGSARSAVAEDPPRPPEKPPSALPPVANDKAAGKAEAPAKPDEKPAADKADDQKKPAPAPNPLVERLQKAVQGRGAQPPAAPPGTPVVRRPVDRAAVDPRAPIDNRAATWLRRAVDHIRLREWNAALELLQRVTDQPEDSLYFNEGSKWVSLRAEANRLRGELPPEVLAEYRTQYGGLARQLLAEAGRRGDLAAYGRVAKGYFHTEAGYEAANRLGALHLDRGELALSASWFAALWRARAPLTEERLWRARALLVFKQAGQAELETEIAAAVAASGGAPIDVGGVRQDPAKWLAAIPAPKQPPETPLADWPVFFGTPRRTGTAAAGDPLLLPRWNLPLTASHTLRGQVEQLAEDLLDQGVFAPSALYPTMVAGKVIYRSLDGVQVVDAATGRLLWETEDRQESSRPFLLGASGRGANDPARMGEGFGWGNRMAYAPGAGEFSPLCNLLYRNASFGIVSSDGRQLFVVEDPMFLSGLQPGHMPQWDGMRVGAMETGSRLASYDLETGRPLWEAGGLANGEAFDPPLAGYFFFGAPVADGGELYVVGEATSGERHGQIRLLALDPATGREKWSQLIAYADPIIEKDIGRRWWAAPVAIDKGLIICPTTVGWLVAVDRVTHSLLWGYRSQTPGAGGLRGRVVNAEMIEQMAIVQNQPLSGGWSQTPPILAAGRVISTPLESQILVCLDQFTGKELWQKPRGRGTYLAGVVDGKVLVVGRESLMALDAATGTPAWGPITTPIASGRGIVAGGRYVLPLTNELWSVDLKDGKQIEKTYLPSRMAPLGNLGMHRGMLLSLGPSGLTAFEQRDAIQKEIAARKAVDPLDPWALIHESELTLLAREQAAALALLRKVSAESAPADLRERRRTLLVETLRAVIRADFSRTETDGDLRELAAAVSTPDERQQLRRLEIECHLARREFSRAFDACLAAAQDDSDALVPRDDTPATSVSVRVWVAGKLADLLASLDDAQRGPFDQRLAELADGVLARSPAEQTRFVQLFSRHAAGQRVAAKLAEAHAAQGDFAAAEQDLLRLWRTADPQTAARAGERLAQLMRQFDLPADAAMQYEALERRFPSVRLSDGKTVVQSLEALRSAGKFPVAGPAFVDWQASGVRIERMGAGYVNYPPQELAQTGSSAPFFQRNRFEIDPARQRLDVTDGASDESLWSVPLRTHVSSFEGALTVARSSAHLLTLVHRGILHALSPVDRKVLWTRPIEGRMAHQQIGRQMNPLQPMQQSLSLVNRADSLGAAGAPLAFTTEELIGCQGRRSMTVYDALTGEVRWTYAGVRPATQVFGGQETIFLRAGGTVTALRASDGKRLELKNLDETLTRALCAVGDRFVLPVAGAATPGLRLFDPLTQADLWKVDLVKGTVMTPLENDRLALLEIDGPSVGRFRLLDLTTGDAETLGTLTADDLRGRGDLHAFADDLNVYLIINKGVNRGAGSEQVPHVRASGVIAAFDPHPGRLRWKQEITEQTLLLERMEHSPLLVFSSRRTDRTARVQVPLQHLVAIDKLSGAKLLDARSAAQPGIRSINVSAAERYIELRGFNDRVRLYPVEKPNTAGEASD